jgi:hypothetical protein
VKRASISIYITITRGVSVILLVMRFPPSGRGIKGIANRIAEVVRGKAEPMPCSFASPHSCAVVGTNCPPRLRGMRETDGPFHVVE